jgi:hypothetical protein
VIYLEENKCKKESVSKCKKCQFYEVENDKCTIKNVAEYTKNEIENCQEYLIHEKYVMY